MRLTFLLLQLFAVFSYGQFDLRNDAVNRCGFFCVLFFVFFFSSPIPSCSGGPTRGATALKNVILRQFGDNFRSGGVYNCRNARGGRFVVFFSFGKAKISTL
jgi:hypothetical protein